MLAMPDTDARLLKKALSAHCGSIPYQRALTAEGAMRVDLAGEPVEPVSPEHRDFAAAAIAEKRARKQRGNAVAPSHPQP